MANAQGCVTVTIGEEEYRIEYSNSDLADADEYMMREHGRSFVAQLQSGDMNLHVARIAFYFGARRHAKNIRSVNQAGHVLDSANLSEVFQAIGEAITAAMRRLGMAPKEEEGEVAEGE